MAFEKSHLAAMANADGQTWWQYKTTEDISTTTAANYFDSAAHMLKVNDLMFLIMSDGFAVHRVKTNTEAVVTLDTKKIKSVS